MTAVVEEAPAATGQIRSGEPRVGPRPAGHGSGPGAGGPTPPTGHGDEPEQRWVEPTAGQRMASFSLSMISGLLLMLLLNLMLVSQWQQATSQVHLYGELRLSLAEGAAPVSPVTSSGQLLALGTPVALMDAPSVGVTNQVVVEGSSSAQTMLGVAHRRNTVMPCQVGTSVLLARAASYGGIGGEWAKLQKGDHFNFTMGQGTCTYQVSGRRVAGAKAPTPPTGREATITLVTASGLPFAPTGVQFIDATLVGNAYDNSGVAIPTGALPASEQPMGVDTGQLFPLTMLMESLVAIALIGTWLWRRWSPMKTWIAVTPLALALLLLTAQCINLLLPNLI